MSENPTKKKPQSKPKEHLASIESFKKTLDKEYTWPASYPFRFVVPTSSLEDFSKLFPDEKLDTRFSKNAKYTAVKFEIHAESADQVVEVYLRVQSIQGIIAL